VIEDVQVVEVIEESHRLSSITSIPSTTSIPS